METYENLLPRPTIAVAHDGCLDLGPGVTVRSAGPESAHLTAQATTELVRCGLTILGAAGPAKTPAHGASDDGPVVVTVTVVADRDEEWYRLTIAATGITIEVTGAPGLAHALTTFTQLLPTDALRLAGPSRGSWSVQCGTVEDSPVFPWRGGMLDVARHFFPKRTVLRYIDLLAAHRFNRLHLHLSDDQGWRIASERFPRLASDASWRASTRLGPEGEHDNTPHGGQYTLADLTEIAAYGRARGVVVVPEIDIPGHTSALRAAYPELGQPGVEHTIQDTVWAGGSSISPTEPVVAFLAEVLDELCGAMDPPYVHLGGDECDMSWWEADPAIAAEMATHGYTQAREMHGHMLRSLATHLRGRGVRTIVWDEGYVTGGVLDDTIVMAWRGDDAAARAATTHDVIRSPLFPTYFNFDQSEDPTEPRSEGGPITLDDVAAFAPAPADWTPTQRAHVLGGQFQVWTEWVPTEERIDYLVFPRAAVLAEVLWAGTPEDPADLFTRLEGHMGRLEALGVAYRPLDGPRPWQRGGTGVWQRTASGTIEETRRWVDSISEEP